MGNNGYMASGIIAPGVGIEQLDVQFEAAMRI